MIIQEINFLCIIYIISLCENEVNTIALDFQSTLKKTAVAPQLIASKLQEATYKIALNAIAT